MPAVNLLRLSSQLLHLILGGVGVFCLVYAAYFSGSDPDITKVLLLEALKFGGLASVIFYFQYKYLFNV
jgi:hypothetical protein